MASRWAESSTGRPARTTAIDRREWPRPRRPRLRRRRWRNYPEVPEFTNHPGHQYLAGSLDYTQVTPASTLVPLQPQTQYTLSGVTPGPAKPVFTLNDGNFKLDNADNSISVDKTGKPRAFTLPWPKSKTCYRMMCRRDRKSFLKVPLNDPLKKISTIILLTYDLEMGGPIIKDQNGNLLTWTQLESVPDSGFINLHIFAEPSVGVGSKHAVDAFARMMRIVLKNGSPLDQQYVFDDYQTSGNLGLCSNDVLTAGIDPTLDLLNLPRLGFHAGGEVANCVRTVIDVP